MSETIQNSIGEPVLTIGDDVPPVHVAWSRVMGEVTALGKHQRNESQRFNFRGIDDVMNLLGPVLRTYGVAIIPRVYELRSRDFTNKSGGLMHEVHVLVEFTIVGPDGDTMTGSAPGESADSGDKATPKAMSVAFRTFLLQSLCLPTDETDPDAQVTDRSPVSTDDEMAQTTANGLASATAIESVQRVEEWAKGKSILGVQVTVGDVSLPLERVFADTYARLGDNTAGEQAEQVLKDSLGATEIDPSSVTEPTEGAQA